MMSLGKHHISDLNSIRNQLRSLYKQKRKVKIYHGSTNSTHPQKFDGDSVVDISNLNRIIAINKGDKYALIEPNVPMDKLVRETLRPGLVPPVVTEFPGITVAGGTRRCWRK